MNDNQHPLLLKTTFDANLSHCEGASFVSVGLSENGYSLEDRTMLVTNTFIGSDSLPKIDENAINELKAKLNDSQLFVDMDRQTESRTDQVFSDITKVIQNKNAIPKDPLQYLKNNADQSCSSLNSTRNSSNDTSSLDITNKNIFKKPKMKKVRPSINLDSTLEVSVADSNSFEKEMKPNVFKKHLIQKRYSVKLDESNSSFESFSDFGKEIDENPFKRKMLRKKHSLINPLEFSATNLEKDVETASSEKITHSEEQPVHGDDNSLAENVKEVTCVDEQINENCEKVFETVKNFEENLNVTYSVEEKNDKESSNLINKQHKVVDVEETNKNENNKLPSTISPINCCNGLINTEFEMDLTYTLEPINNENVSEVNDKSVNIITECGLANLKQNEKLNITDMLKKDNLKESVELDGNLSKSKHDDDNKPEDGVNEVISGQNNLTKCDERKEKSAANVAENVFIVDDTNENTRPIEQHTLDVGDNQEVNLIVSKEIEIYEENLCIDNQEVCLDKDTITEKDCNTSNIVANKNKSSEKEIIEKLENTIKETNIVDNNDNNEFEKLEDCEVERVAEISEDNLDISDYVEETMDIPIKRNPFKNLRKSKHSLGGNLCSPEMTTCSEYNVEDEQQQNTETICIDKSNKTNLQEQNNIGNNLFKVSRKSKYSLVGALDETIFSDDNIDKDKEQSIDELSVKSFLKTSKNKTVLNDDIIDCASNAINLFRETERIKHTIVEELDESVSVNNYQINEKDYVDTATSIVNACQESDNPCLTADLYNNHSIPSNLILKENESNKTNSLRNMNGQRLDQSLELNNQCKIKEKKISLEQNCTPVIDIIQKNLELNNKNCMDNTKNEGGVNLPSKVLNIVENTSTAINISTDTPVTPAAVVSGDNNSNVSRSGGGDQQLLQEESLQSITKGQEKSVDTNCDTISDQSEEYLSCEFKNASNFGLEEHKEENQRISKDIVEKINMPQVEDVVERTKNTAVNVTDDLSVLNYSNITDNSTNQNETSAVEMEVENVEVLMAIPTNENNKSISTVGDIEIETVHLIEDDLIVEDNLKDSPNNKSHSHLINKLSISASKKVSLLELSSNNNSLGMMSLTVGSMVEEMDEECSKNNNSTYNNKEMSTTEEESVTTAVDEHSDIDNLVVVNEKSAIEFAAEEDVDKLMVVECEKDKQSNKETCLPLSYNSIPENGLEKKVIVEVVNPNTLIKIDVNKVLAEDVDQVSMEIEQVIDTDLNIELKNKKENEMAKNKEVNSECEIIAEKECEKSNVSLVESLDLPKVQETSTENRNFSKRLSEKIENLHNVTNTTSNELVESNNNDQEENTNINKMVDLKVNEINEIQTVNQKDEEVVNLREEMAEENCGNNNLEKQNQRGEVELLHDENSSAGGDKQLAANENVKNLQIVNTEQDKNELQKTLDLPEVQDTRKKRGRKKLENSKINISSSNDLNLNADNNGNVDSSRNVGSSSTVLKSRRKISSNGGKNDELDIDEPVGRVSKTQVLNTIEEVKAVPPSKKRKNQNHNDSESSKKDLRKSVRESKSNAANKQQVGSNSNNFAELSLSFDVSAIPSNDKQSSKKHNKYNSTPLVRRSLRSRKDSVSASSQGIVSNSSTALAAKKKTSPRGECSSMIKTNEQLDEKKDQEKLHPRQKKGIPSISTDDFNFTAPKQVPRKSSFYKKHNTRRSVTFRPHSSLIPSSSSEESKFKSSTSFSKNNSSVSPVSAGKKRKISNIDLPDNENEVSTHQSVTVKAVIHESPKSKRRLPLFHSTPKGCQQAPRSFTIVSQKLSVTTDVPASAATSTSFYTTLDTDSANLINTTTPISSRRSLRSSRFKSNCTSSYDSHPFMATKYLGTTNTAATVNNGVGISKLASRRTSKRSSNNIVREKLSITKSVNKSQMVERLQADDVDLSSCLNRPPDSFNSSTFSEIPKVTSQQSGLIMEAEEHNNDHHHTSLKSKSFQMSLRSSRSNILNQSSELTETSSVSQFNDTTASLNTTSTIQNKNDVPVSELSLQIHKHTKKVKQLEDSVFGVNKIRKIKLNSQEKLPKLAKPAKWVRNELYTFLDKKLRDNYPLEKRYLSERTVIILCNAVSNTLFGHGDISLQQLKEELVKYNICKTQLDYYTFLDRYTPVAFKDIVMPGSPFLNEKYFDPTKTKVFDPIL